MEEPRLHPHLTEAGVECPPPGARLLSSPQTHLCCVVLCCLSSDLKIFLSSSSPTSTPQAPSPPPPCLDRKIHRRLLFLFSSQVAFATNPQLDPFDDLVP
ncbi:hypothetical protein Drorol1_Dr00022219 [Drosera rotundifolia]